MALTREFARCLDCCRQTCKVKAKFIYSYLKRQECRQLRMIVKQRRNAAPVVEPQEPLEAPEIGIG
eukprot:2378259-Amphidinium_carterae.1